MKKDSFVSANQALKKSIETYGELQNELNKFVSKGTFWHFDDKYVFDGAQTAAIKFEDVSPMIVSMSEMLKRAGFNVQIYNSTAIVFDAAQAGLARRLLGNRHGNVTIDLDHRAENRDSDWFKKISDFTR